MLINSALVSAQNRQRLYWVGKRNDDGTYSKVLVEQPEDRGILLRDILETGVCWRDKSYTLDANYYKGGNLTSLEKQSGKRLMVAEPVNVESYEISHTCDFNVTPSGTLRVAYTDKSESQGYRVYCADYKSVAMRGQGNGRGAELVAERINDIRCANGGGAGAKTGLYAVPTPIEYSPLDNCDVVITDNNIRCSYKDGSGTAMGYSVYFDNVKSPTVISGQAAKMKIIERVSDKKQYPVYEVRDGLITIKGKQYPIKLRDGYYILRKLTVRECMRLQTVPEWYEFPVSDSQAYKMLGNGWTCEVIAHLIRSAIGGTA